MTDQIYVGATAALIVGLFLFAVVRKAFDPFAPIWLFLCGYVQMYVVQATSYRDYAIRVRGLELVTLANARAFWALAWFAAVYYFGIGRWVARRLPSAPVRWSRPMILAIAPPLVLWGLLCAGMVGQQTDGTSAEENLFRSFPIVMLVAAILLIVTGRSGPRPNRAITWTGMGLAVAYVAIWMFNGKRSHSLFGILTALCAYYSSQGKRPSTPTLVATALAGALAVSMSLGWRGNVDYERSASGFIQYLGDFKVANVLVNANLADRSTGDLIEDQQTSQETEEYCGYLLMLDTVPGKSDYDYGSNYIRLVSTYIPRIVWSDKPIFGRDVWAAAWVAGSEFPRTDDFTGPSIGILGATQLNGGDLATAIVLAILATLLRGSYEYFRLYEQTAWAQAWWALTYYNAWLMTVNDDPFVWFYYVYGHTTLPPMLGLWIYHRCSGDAARV